MMVALALGRVRTMESFEALMKLLDDGDWRVTVNALRAIQAFSAIDAPAQEKIIKRFSAKLSDENYHIRRTALEMLSRVQFFNRVEAQQNIAPLIASKMNDASSDISQTALRALAQAFPSVALSYLYAWNQNGGNNAAALEAIGIIAQTEKQIRPELSEQLKLNVKNKDVKTAAAAVQGLGIYWKLAPNDSTYETALLDALAFHAEKQNSAAVQYALESLADTAFVKPRYASIFLNALSLFKSADNAETVLALLDALIQTKEKSAANEAQKLLNDENNAVRQKAARAIEKLTGEAPLVNAISKPATPPDLTKLNGLTKNPIAVLSTKYGDIEIELFLKEATFTVLNFMGLAEKIFFDGLIFHRVVSNFVVQGGDPKGDGTGGSTNTIRSEFTHRRYERGALGMASAGKDTESSQWFVMHASHPHLDGRYTLFGKVVRGMKAMDKLEQGDKMITVRFK